jgi:hypothetical protein
VSGQAGRYQRSAGGLVGAMVVLFVVVVGWVVLRSLVSEDPVREVRSVDYSQELAAARQSPDLDVVAPSSLPQGWRATTVRYVPGATPEWHLGVLTDRERYVGLEQSTASVTDLVETYVDEAATRRGPVEVAGRRWTSYTDATGDLALVRREGRTTTLVVGHDVGRPALVAYTAGLR